MYVYQNYYKNVLLLKYKKNYVLVNIRMINLSLDELRLITQSRNISGYENKSKDDLTKALSESEPKLEPKPKSKLKSEPKIEVKVN